MSRFAVVAAQHAHLAIGPWSVAARLALIQSTLFEQKQKASSACCCIPEGGAAATCEGWLIKRAANTSERSGNAEALAAISVMGLVPVAERGAQMVRAISPGAASDDAVIAIPSRSCASVTRIAVIFVVPAIFRPIPNVAVNVVKTPRVRTKTVHAYGLLRPPALLALSVSFVALVVGLVRRDR